MEFGGPGKIAPAGVMPLDAPPVLVRSAAVLAKWAMPPDAIVANVFGVANTLVRAGWAQVVSAPPWTLAPLTPSVPRPK